MQIAAAAGGLAVVESGIVVISGLLLIGSAIYVMAEAGERVADVFSTSNTREKYKKCCCGYLGPSGEPCVHVIMKKSRKEAEEAALHYGNANGVEFHPHNTHDKFPHFHPTRNNVKIPGVHFCFPKL